jgi:hypothetical protein
VALESDEPPINNAKYLALYEKVPEIDLYYVEEYKLKHPDKKVTSGLSGDLLERLHGVKTWN